MRHSLHLLLLIISFLFVSCQKELTDPSVTGTPPGSGGTGSFRMKINGEQWIADRFAGASIMNGRIALTGISTTKKSFLISIEGTTAGTYDLLPAGDHAAALQDSTDANPLIGFTSNQGADTTQSGGRVVITKIDTVKKTISGTFTARLFRMIDNKTKIITEGVFENLPYTTTLPPASTTDTLRVKIDGVEWKPDNIAAVVASITNQLAIVGNNAAGTKSVGITMPAAITAASYTFDFFGAQYIGQYNVNASTFLVSESGTLTILEHNRTTKRIRGTFNFKAIDIGLGPTTAQLTEGYFSVKYQ